MIKRFSALNENISCADDVLFTFEARVILDVDSTCADILEDVLSRVNNRNGLLREINQSFEKKILAGVSTEDFDAGRLFDMTVDIDECGSVITIRGEYECYIPLPDISSLNQSLKRALNDAITEIFPKLSQSVKFWYIRNLLPKIQNVQLRDFAPLSLVDAITDILGSGVYYTANDFCSGHEKVCLVIDECEGICCDDDTDDTVSFRATIKNNKVDYLDTWE